jgi:predicted RecA/RadA family phage recombinase
MTAATAAVDTPRRDGKVVAYEVASSETIYKGTQVCLDATGYAVSSTGADGEVFVGVAYETIDNSSGSDGDKKIRVYRKGIFEFALPGAAITDIGTEVYSADDLTVQKTQDSAEPKVGMIAAFENSGKVFIDIGGYC